MTLGLGMQHLGLGPNTVCSNDDLWLTLTFLYPLQNVVLVGILFSACVSIRDSEILSTFKVFTL